MAFVWLTKKRFQTSWHQIKIVIAAIAVIAANFTFLHMLTDTAGTFLPNLSFSIVTLIAIIVTLLYLTGRSKRDIGVLKSLGANRLTITATYSLELIFVGIIGSLIGIFLVAVSLFSASFLPQMGFILSINLGQALGYAVTVCIFGVIISTVLGFYLTWKEAGRAVMEILTHAQ
ncbi:MAG: FtsX-like permease family protein [Candidatus Bathyarchaeota archaeon]